MKRFPAPVLCMLLVTAIGCKGKPGEDEASIQKRLDDKGTVDLGQQALLKTLEEQKRAATDDVQRAAIDEQIEELKQSAAGATADSDPAKEHNAALIAKYRDDFEKLQAEEQRISAELQKGSQGGQGGR